MLYTDEDGFWIAECPSLPGCVSQGDSEAEAIVNIREAIDGYIESLRAHGDPVPDDNAQMRVVEV
jgi:predicted RNase H-like HicB family nuclease